MFSFLMTQGARARRDAQNWLEVADKVFHYRRDQLTDAELAELNRQREDLRQRVKRKADASEIKLGIEALEPVLHKFGGAVYPKTALADNVEFFLAAALIIIGIRTFVVQPFKIPTNSMWPSYHGMKSKLYPVPAEAPGWAVQAINLLQLGATRHSVVAPASGELEIPFELQNGRPTVKAVSRAGRKWWVLPTTVREYTFFVDGQPVCFEVPADFSEVDSMVEECFLRKCPQDRVVPFLGELRSRGRARLKVGRFAKGEAVFSFDVLAGDHLFVDRFSYHFFDPEVGEGFVFRTRHIERLRQDQYYIKRLVGVPGDLMEIRSPALLRNGQPITGAVAFEMNAREAGQYRGYGYGVKADGWLGLLGKGEVLRVPQEAFLALGDNSYNSLDGRAWGFVPRKEVMGRPLFIFYPFSRRWGPTR